MDWKYAGTFNIIKITGRTSRGGTSSRPQAFYVSGSAVSEAPKARVQWMETAALENYRQEKNKLEATDLQRVTFLYSIKIW